MNLLQSLIRPHSVRGAGWAGRDVYDMLTGGGAMTFGGGIYPLGTGTSLSFREEEIGAGFASYAHMAMMANPIVFACMEYRRKTFSQAYFQWQRLRAGTAGPAGEFFGTSALELLEQPWTNATTPDMLNIAIQYADLGGNAIIVRRDRQLSVLRPDWLSIIAASERQPEQGIVAIDAKVQGYAYWAGGKGYGEPELLLPEEVAHFAPIPDPTARFRGMSWLTPAIRDIMGDQAAATHKLKYFENGASGAVVVKLDPTVVNTLDKFDAWVEKMEQGHKGAMNAYRTWYLSSAADVQTVGANLRQEDFAVTVGKGESRIASDAGVPPVLVGFSEGLASATYSNYAMARRAYIDSTLWDLWGNMAGALQSILPTPSGCRLWVDGRRIPLLQEDEKDRAEIQQMDAGAINTLVTAGYEPDSVVAAVTSGDLTRLVHSGLYSVQLQKPGAEEPAEPEEAAPPVAAPRPTVAQQAHDLGVSERTLRRWRQRDA
jgi:phage portal protein BeeE